MTTNRAIRSLAVVLAVTMSGAVLAACGGRPKVTPAPAAAPPGTPAPSPGVLPIGGTSLASAAQLAAWFTGRQPQPSGTYQATVPVATLALYFVEEGAREGIRGDVAFVQSILETGWFRFGGSVPATNNNFAGIGATDGGGVPAAFPDARTGVRAQIQHLRAYADATATTCTVPPLHAACVDPRFHLVTPKGKAPTWNQMGNGNWATSTTYAARIIQLYREMLAFNGIPAPF
jgi:hypothetical protein